MGGTRLAPGHRPGRDRDRAAGAGRLRQDPGREAGGRVDPAAQAVGVLQRPPHAVELGLLGSNPVDRIQWTASAVAQSVDRRVVVSPAQAETLLNAAGRLGLRGERLETFFACLYYAALRPWRRLCSARRTCTCRRPGGGEVARRAGHGVAVLHEAAADMLWVQIQPSNYRRLVEERGWSHRAFERWHAAAMIAALLEPSGAR